ncbi:hypothetical protein HAX54_028196, partial [Datura stramonium]|nr:hypothetical protein [Datura stramonium]
TRTFLINRDVSFIETIFPFKGVKDELEDIFCAEPPIFVSDHLSVPKVIVPVDDVEPVSSPYPPAELTLPILEDSTLLPEHQPPLSPILPVEQSHLYLEGLVGQSNHLFGCKIS